MLIRFDPNFVQSIQDKEATASESGTVFTVNVDGKICPNSLLVDTTRNDF